MFTWQQWCMFVAARNGNSIKPSVTEQLVLRRLCSRSSFFLHTHCCFQVLFQCKNDVGRTPLLSSPYATVIRPASCEISELETNGIYGLILPPYSGRIRKHSHSYTTTPRKCSLGVKFWLLWCQWVIWLVACGHSDVVIIRVVASALVPKVNLFQYFLK